MNNPQRDTDTGSTSPAPTLVEGMLTPEVIGHPVAKIPVELSIRFLEHFSETLYSSPQKAFEELISNSWDAALVWRKRCAWVNGMWKAQESSLRLDEGGLA